MSSPEEHIEMALFAKVEEYTDLPLKMPNVDEDPPADAGSHVVVSHHRNGSQRLSMSGGQNMFIGMLQMLVRCPRGAGPNEIRKRGGDIAALFPEDMVLVESGTRVRITKRPVLGTAAPARAFYEMPVSIYYEAFI